MLREKLGNPQKAQAIGYHFCDIASEIFDSDIFEWSDFMACLQSLLSQQNKNEEDALSWGPTMVWPEGAILKVYVSRLPENASK